MWELREKKVALWLRGLWMRTDLIYLFIFIRWFSLLCICFFRSNYATIFNIWHYGLWLIIISESMWPNSFCAKKKKKMCFVVRAIFYCFNIISEANCLRNMSFRGILKYEYLWMRLIRKLYDDCVRSVMKLI